MNRIEEIFVYDTSFFYFCSNLYTKLNLAFFAYFFGLAKVGSLPFIEIKFPDKRSCNGIPGNNTLTKHVVLR